MFLVRAIMSHFLAFIMSILLTIVPYKGFRLPVLDTAQENCLFNVELISDTHIEVKAPLRTFFLKQGLKNIAHAKTPADAIIMPGDMTNYADEPSLEKYYGIISQYSPVPVISAHGNHDIGHAGDRNVTTITREQARDNYIRYQNAYAGTDHETPYYAQEVNGYKFIVLADEVLDGGHFDSLSISQAQLDFLDEQLADGTKDGKPVFVICHWPIKDRNGEQTLWPGSGIDPVEDYDIPAILEKYNNVFYISGHMHSGLKSTAVGDLFGLRNAETVNGVHYISVPSFGQLNIFGIPWSGIGAQLEIYADKVIFRPINFVTKFWYANAEHSFSLVS